MTRIVPKINPILESILNSTDPSNESFIDFIQLQLSAESLIYKKMHSDNPYETAYFYDRHEYATFGTWNNNISASLKTMYTQSNQEQSSFYKNVYVNSDTTSSVQFALTYGDFEGTFETSKSFGEYEIDMKESKIIYTQLNNLLNDSKKEKLEFKYPSWQNKIESASRVYSYGQNISGSFGNGTETETGVVITLNDYEEVFAGYAYSTALKTDGTIVSWGDNKYGQLGLGNITYVYYPTEVSYSKQWKMLSSGPEHSLAIKKDGTLWAWGRNDFGQLGDGTITNSNVPVLIDSGQWQFVSAGKRFSCAIKSDGTLWTWGDNTRGQLGNGTSGVSPIVPAQAGVSEDWKKIYASCQTGSDGFAIGILKDGSMWGFGSNDSYQLGLGDTVDRFSPTFITGSKWNIISPGATNSYAINDANEIYRWGLNPINSTSDQIPTNPENFGNDWLFVKNSIRNTVGIKTNKNLYYWGIDSTGLPAPLSNDFVLEEQRLLNNYTKHATVSDYFEELNGSSLGHFLSIKQFDIEEKTFTHPDFVYAITIDSECLHDGLEPGLWELSLRSVNIDGTIIDVIEPITLIDDSILTDKSIDRKDVYNIYSGSIANGLYTGSYSLPFGLFYPNNGIILLNGMSLYSFNSILVNRNLNPINTIYTSISGAMQYSNDNSFVANSFERVESMCAFARIMSDEFNYSNNPTYTQFRNGPIKNKIIQNTDGLVYFTTVGLYNDAKELLAVAKLSKPILKTPNVDLVIKIKIQN